MRANRLFWPLALIILGGLFLLNNMNILRVNIWGVFFPILLILGGLSVLGGSISHARRGETTALSIPLEGSEKARVKVSYGAGRIDVGGGAAPGELLSGTFDGGVNHTASRADDGLNVKLEGPSDVVTAPWWGWSGDHRWHVRLSEKTPIALDIETGAAEAHIDLTDVRVTDLRVQTGASDTKLRLPARAGQTQGKISGGVASITITVPPEVGARIQYEGGLSSMDVDTNRFPQNGKVYQSPNYGSAANRIDLRVEMGVGSVKVR